MDTVQNIGSVIVGGSSGQTNPNNAQHGSNEQSDVDNYYASSAAQPKMVVARQPQPMPSPPPSVRKIGRREFLSRPNWLFGHNENVLFCTALNSLRFPDQNNVPRKFIEEWLSDRMVNMETEWYAGARFLNETINDLKKEPEKFHQKKMRIWRNRQRGFYSRHQQNLRSAERAYAANISEESKMALESAKREASIPMEELRPPEPTVAEVALEELQTKIIRRLQGQTDRLDMAEQLAHKPYEEPNRLYFQQLQNEVLAAISEKHTEISVERDKVETKSKQSRKRRRNQVSNGVTMSGSATRVRFTNREIAMLIHWVYSWPKDEWSNKIAEYYTKTGHTRSAEHVRDKIRDLINRSKDREHGGLSSIKARVTGSYFTKPNEPEELRRLAMNDLQDFKYPEGVLQQVPGGRYFDEERAAWTDGPLPTEYIQRYHDEVRRLRDVVRVKIIRNVDRQGNPTGTGAAVATTAAPDNGVAGVYDMRLVSPNATMQFPTGSYHSQAQDYSAESDFALAKDLQESTGSSHIFWDSTNNTKQDRDKDNNDDMAALASAALKPETEEFLHLEQEPQDHPDVDPQVKDSPKSKIAKR